MIRRSTAEGDPALEKAGGRGVRRQPRVMLGRLYLNARDYRRPCSACEGSWTTAGYPKVRCCSLGTARGRSTDDEIVTETTLEYNPSLPGPSSAG